MTQVDEKEDRRQTNFHSRRECRVQHSWQYFHCRQQTEMMKPRQLRSFVLGIGWGRLSSGSHYRWKS